MCTNVWLGPIPSSERHDSVSITEPGAWGILCKHKLHYMRAQSYVFIGLGRVTPALMFYCLGHMAGRCCGRVCGFVIAHVCDCTCVCTAGCFPEWNKKD